MQRLGPYKIKREVGRGGMGVVYETTDPLLDRPVALKVILQPPDQEEQAREHERDRLYREARSAARLAHPNIVAVFKAGEIDRTAYIEMELVRGESLEQHLQREPLSVEESLDILRQAATGLDFAHGNGVVHRDVKPGNLMLCADGTVKIADFGIAKLFPEQAFTWSGELAGSPEYMSPEQVQEHVVSGRSDQYSLATVAYRLLTGEPTFSADNLAQLVYRIVFEAPVPAHVVNPLLSSVVSTVLQKALAKDQAERFECCTQFIDALQEAIHLATGEIPAALGPSVLPAATTANGLAGPSVDDLFRHKQAKSVWVRHPFLSGVLFTLLLLAACLLFFMQRSGFSGTAQPPLPEAKPVVHNAPVSPR